MTWPDVEEEAAGRLGAEAAKNFQSLTKNFNSYPTRHTSDAFYEFAYGKGLSDCLAGFRFDRLRLLMEASVSVAPAPGGRVLDIGTGTGLVAAWWSAAGAAAEILAYDSAPHAGVYLPLGAQRVGEPEAHSPLACDRLLALDAFGEIHSDEDGVLRDPALQGHPDYDAEAEGRYGLAAKAKPWKRHLRPGGALLLSEPIGEPALWGAFARNFARDGWRVDPSAWADGTGLILRPG